MFPSSILSSNLARLSHKCAHLKGGARAQFQAQHQRAQAQTSDSKNIIFAHILICY